MEEASGASTRNVDDDGRTLGICSTFFIFCRLHYYFLSTRSRRCNTSNKQFINSKLLITNESPHSQSSHEPVKLLLDPALDSECEFEMEKEKCSEKSGSSAASLSLEKSISTT